MSCRHRLAAMFCAAVLATAPSALAQNGDQPGGGGAADDPMAAMMEAARPGPEHELLKQFVGTWRARAVMWFGPEPMTSEGTMTNTLVLDGRFLRHEYEADMMGEPFKGLGYWGYDKGRKEWVGTWMDTWSTGIMTSRRGTYDAASKTWTMHATYFNPETGEEEKQKEVVKVIDPDTHVMQMFMVGPGGEEQKVMEITYTRKAAGGGRE